MVPLLMSFLNLKTNAPEYTYSMNKRSKSVADVKVQGWWITSCTVDIGELSLSAN